MFLGVRNLKIRVKKLSGTFLRSFFDPKPQKKTQKTVIWSIFSIKKIIEVLKVCDFNFFLIFIVRLPPFTGYKQIICPITNKATKIQFFVRN